MKAPTGPAGPEEPRGSVPGAGWAAGLLLLAALLFITGGLPLQILLGEWGLVLAQLLFLLLPALLLLRWGSYDLRRTLSLRIPGRPQVVGGFLVLIGGVQVAWYLSWLQSFVVPVPVELLEAMSEMLAADSIPRFLQLLVVAAVVPAVAEETLFRGAALGAFRNRFPAPVAVILTGLVFGLFHLTPETAFRFLPTAWLGILLGWVVVASRSLPLAILLHFVNNAMILSLTALPITRERVTGPEEAPPLLLLPVAVGLLAWGLVLVHRAAGERTGRAGGGA